MAASGLCFESTSHHREWVASQSTLPRGFKVSTSAIEFVPGETGKAAKMDLALIACDRPTPDFAAVFTRNAFPGAPVIIGRERLNSETLAAIIVNNKISNVGAAAGVEVSERICGAVADEMGLSPDEIMPASTGIIGWKLPQKEILAALPGLVAGLQSETVLPAAEAIMTTDLYPKVRRAQLGVGSVVGIAKGAGMIEPNLATMLVYLLTDLAVPRDELRQCLRLATTTSFNAISIDSDQSTSDSVVLMSSGRVPCQSVHNFAQALEDVCRALAGDVVRNGEGVKHVIRVKVKGAPDVVVAKGVGKSVVNSPLVQCAIAGNDPNVGRILMAVGKYIGDNCPGVDTSGCRIEIGGVEVFSGGVFSLDPVKEQALHDYMVGAQLYETVAPDRNGVYRPPVDWPAHERTVDILVDLACGQARFEVLGADRTHEYISENADYRS